MKRIATILLSVFLTLGLAGCWSSTELTEMAIVTAFGIDKGDDGFRISVQVVNPGEIAAKNQSYGVPTTVYAADGKSMFEAIRRITTMTSRKLYFSHVRVVLFGEELAKDGIKKPLDFLSRDHEMRADFVMAIAKEMKAEDAIKILTPMEKVAANKIYTSIENSEKNWAPTKLVLLDDLVGALVSQGKQPVITGLEVLGNPNIGNKQENIQQVKVPTIIKTNKIAVFDDDKLVGWLDEKESKGFNYITDNVTNTVGYVECEGGGTVTIELIRSKTKMKGKFENGTPKINLTITAEANVADVECPINLTNSKAIRDLEKQFNDKTKEIVLGSVEKAKTLEADVFGFGEEIERVAPKKWEEIKNNWDEIFPTTEVVVKTDIKIRRLGTISDSFQEELEK